MSQLFFTGSGDQPTVYEGSGYEAIEELGSGSEPTTEEERDTRSTTMTSEEVEPTELPSQVSPKPAVEEVTPIPPNNASASLIYAILKVLEADKASENSTPAVPDKLDNNTILIPLETIQLTPEMPFTTTERTDVEVSERLEDDGVLPVDLNMPEIPWSAGSWVRFPDETPEESSLDITPRDDDNFSPKFRFPEEKINPEQRPAILRFWSSIPMYKEEIQGAKSDEQWAPP